MEKILTNIYIRENRFGGHLVGIFSWLKKKEKKKLYLNVYEGTCYATSECETKGGTTSGSCAAGTV